MHTIIRGMPIIMHAIKRELLIITHTIKRGLLMNTIIMHTIAIKRGLRRYISTAYTITKIYLNKVYLTFEQYL